METKTFTEEEIQAGLNIAHQEYMLQVIGLLSYGTQKELTYVKVPVTTPNGGVYLVSILHIEGPKISLENLAKVTDEQPT